MFPVFRGIKVVYQWVVEDEQLTANITNESDGLHRNNETSKLIGLDRSVAKDHQNGNGSASTTNPGIQDALTFLDFFAGAGLVRLGLEPNWSCIWSNDIDPRKREVYEAHFGSDDFLLGDISKVDAGSLPNGADLAWSSFPCQDLSVAGWRRGMHGRRSGTFWEFWRLMRDSLDRGNRPSLVVIENVVGLLYGEDFSILCEALVALGMQFGAFVVDARLFVPQSRPRVFVVAVDSEVDCSPFLNEGDPKEKLWFTKAVRSAYSRLPNAIKGSWRWWRLPKPPLTNQNVEAIIEKDPTGVEWHTRHETERLLNMMTPRNLHKIDNAVLRGPSVGFLYKRVRSGVQRAEVRFDGIAGCLRTPQGGSSRQIVVVLDEDQLRTRLLSPREAARLMGVPDSFWLPPRYNDAYRAIGDGVAVPVVQWLSNELLIGLASRCRNRQYISAQQINGIADQRRLPGMADAESPAAIRAAAVS